MSRGDLRDPHMTYREASGRCNQGRSYPRQPLMTSPRPIHNPSNLHLAGPKSGNSSQDNKAAIQRLVLPIFPLCLSRGSHAKQLLAAWLSGPVHSSLRLSRWICSAVIGTVVQEAETSSEGSHKRKPHFLLICFSGIWALRASATSLDAEMVAHRVYSRTGGWNTRSTNLEVVAVRLKYLLFFA